MAIEEYLAYIKTHYPEHAQSLNFLLQSKKIYIETSAFNYFINVSPIEAVINTRVCQGFLNKNWLISPVTLWEIMLTRDDFSSDKLLLFAQNIFSEYMLATPSEIIVRYLEHAYPDNKVNYSFLSNIPMSSIWKNMVKDNSTKFKYNKEDFNNFFTSIHRRISKNLVNILNGQILGKDSIIDSVTRSLSVVYECVVNDGWELPEAYPERNKLTLLFMLLFMVIKVDIEKIAVNEFWAKKKMNDASLIDMIIYLTEDYPELFWRGPFLEMANMAYFQYKAGRNDRGIILDSIHMIYMPYVDIFITNDGIFKSFKKENPHYKNKIFHTTELQLVPVFFNKN